MKNKKKLIIAGALVFALLVAGIGGTLAFAQGPAGAGNPLQNLYLSTLAQKLGTTVDKLQQAMLDARKDSTAQAVKQGLLTQAQADQLLQREFARGVQTSIQSARLDAAAKTLGMPTSDLTTALKTQTLLQIANAKNVDAAKLRTAIADAEKAAIDQAVKDGKLPQAQADKLKANLKPENIDLNRFGFGGANGRGGRGMMPNGMGNPNGFGKPGMMPNGNGFSRGGMPPMGGKR